MDEPRLFATYVDELKLVGPSRFAARITSPMLLVRSLGPEDDSDVAYDTKVTHRDEVSQRTARTSDRPPSRTSDRPPDFAQKLMPGHVLRVTKRADAAFAERIGIGRAPNADVRIPIAQVSKYHAFFAHGLESWTLTDAGSSNGTFVADVELEARVPHPVADGVEVAFGACRLRFYTPEGFVRFATSRLR
jgi:hypothetical protein